LRIAITGPESTGKSELARDLSKHYNIVFVPEFAREYLSQLGRSYNQTDLTIIARGQLSYWNQFDKGQSFISDSEMITMKIWSEVKYQKCDEYILQALSNQKFDQYLLCYPDLLWQADKLREHPSKEDRLNLFSLYKKEFDHLGFKYDIITGNSAARLNSAVKIIDRRL